MSSTVPQVQNYADDLQGIIEKLMSNGTNNLQVHDKYILPPHERPQMISDQVSCYSESIPVVDLKDLDGPNRTRVIQEIRRVCEEDGFFQVHVQPSIHVMFNTFFFSGRIVMIAAD